MDPRSAFEIANPFLAVAPGFRTRWDAFLAFWGDDKEADEQTYTAMGELAQFLVDRYAAGDTEQFADIFSVVEAFLAEDDAEFENLIQVGLFETLQNVASHRPFGFSVFEAWLGPKATPVWKQADHAMTIAASTGKPRWWQFWTRLRQSRRKRALRNATDPKLREIVEAEFRGDT